MDHKELHQCEIDGMEEETCKMARLTLQFDCENPHFPADNSSPSDILYETLRKDPLRPKAKSYKVCEVERLRMILTVFRHQVVAFLSLYLVLSLNIVNSSLLVQFFSFKISDAVQKKTKLFLSLGTSMASVH